MRKTIVTVLITVITMIATFGSITTVYAFHGHELPSFEKVDTIKNAKSDVYYCEMNNRFYIYSKKSGIWLEMSTLEKTSLPISENEL